MSYSLTLRQPSDSDQLSLYSNFTFDNMNVSNRRIVILGKTGAGKSSLANTIFGEELFKFNHSLNSETKKCQAETRSVNGRRITLIDTPGFFDTDDDEDKLKREIVRCITECAPGPHAFLIVLKVERFTEQEQAVINKIHKYFSEEVFRYATVVFTHGDQLPEGEKIEEFVCQNKSMSDLVKKCGGRCHVIDNKYWNKNPKDEYRSNKFQVEKLLNTIDEVTEANKGGYYTNEMLQEVQEIIEQEKKHIRKSSEKMSEEEITQKARDSAYKKIWIRLAGVGTGALLGALFGVLVMVVVAVSALKELVSVAKTVAAIAEIEGAAGGGAAAGGAAAAGGGAAVGGAAGGTAGGAAVGGGAAAGEAAAGGAAGGGAAGAGITLLSVTKASAAVGAVMGGVTGYRAAEGADTPWEAAKMAAAAVEEGGLSVIDRVSEWLKKIFKDKPE